jgi:3'-5' exoribonuclease Rv2179c-like domain
MGKKYFIDTEFHERKILDVDTIELISIGIVCEDGREFYAISNEFDLISATNNKWLLNNVLKHLMSPETWFSKIEIRDSIIAFINETKPEFYGYYCDYDWVVFCWLFGRMIDLPKGYPMYCKDLKQMFDEIYQTEQHDKIKQHPDYPKQVKEHNAISDAKWNYELYKFLTK